MPAQGRFSGRARERVELISWARVVRPMQLMVEERASGASCPGGNLREVTCGFCFRAKQLLDAKGVDYRGI